MKKNLPPKEYYESLAKVPTSGAAIIRNSKGEFLIVKPTYKDYWDLPGGMTELNETPRQAAIREVKEELDIDIEDPRSFCVDFFIGDPFNRILFLFDCGTMDEQTIKKIRIDTDELAEYRFVAYEDALKLLGLKLSNRLKNSLDALEKGSCVYLENSENQ